MVWSYSGSTFTAEAKYRWKPFGQPATPLVTSSLDPRFKFAQQETAPITKLVHMDARNLAPDLGQLPSRHPAIFGAVVPFGPLFGRGAFRGQLFHVRAGLRGEGNRYGPGELGIPGPLTTNCGILSRDHRS